MSRRLSALDRLWTLVLGLALLAGGLLLIDWRFGLVLSGYPDSLSTGAASDVVAAGWWPWAAAAGGVVLGLLGLWWLLAHVRRPGPSTLRAAASDPTGRVEVDLRSVASAVADQLEQAGPIRSASGSTAQGARHTSAIVVKAKVEPDADAASLEEAVSLCTAQVKAAFPDDPVACRVIVDAPGRQRRSAVRRDRVRVA